MLKRKLTQSSQDAVNRSNSVHQHGDKIFMFFSLFGSFSFTADGTPLHVGMENGNFIFYTKDVGVHPLCLARSLVTWTPLQSDYKIQSKVTETEDVSYVSSPYLPDCIRRGSKNCHGCHSDKADLSEKIFRPRGMTSNAHRAYESAAGKSDIKDEYNEVRSLNVCNA